MYVVHATTYMGAGRGVEGGPPGMKAKILVNPTPYDAAPPPLHSGLKPIQTLQKIQEIVLQC